MACRRSPREMLAGVSQPSAECFMAVVARFDEDVAWLRRFPIAYTIVNKSAAIPNTGYDSSSFLWWIISNYERLPQYMLFLHAHERAWHHARYSQLASAYIAIENLPAHGFLSINHKPDGEMFVNEKPLVRELSRAEHIQLRISILGIDTALPGDGSVRWPACAQFWVRRERVLARPRHYYARLYQTMTDAAHPLLSRTAPAEGYPNRSLHNLFLEAYWHWIFGEPERYVAPFVSYVNMPFVTGIVPGLDGSLPQRMRRRASQRLWRPGGAAGKKRGAGRGRGSLVGTR